MLTLAAGAIEPMELTIFLLSLGVLLGLAKLLGEIANALGQPSVLGEILAGVILGPTLLGMVAPDFYLTLFPKEGNVFIGLEILITLSVVLLLLVAGLEVDLSSVWRQGKAAALVSITGMVIPFAVGFPLAWFAPGLLGLEDPEGRLPFALFVGIALSITALPVIAKILMDLNLGKSDIGALIMSSAMVNDLVGWIGFALILAMVAPDTGEGAGGLTTTIVMTFVFLGLLLTLGRYLAHRALPIVQANTTWPGGVLVFVLTVAIFCAAFTEWLGIHSIFGAFIAGVVLGDSSHLRERTRDTIHQFVTNFFAPLFFASIGLRVDFVGAFDLVMVVVVLVVACVGKIGGCYLGARLGGLPNRESWAVGSGMVARGAMEIILGQLAYNHGLIGEELLVAIIIMALVTSLISGPAMRSLLRYKPQRTLRQVISDRGFVPRLKATDARSAIRELAEVAAPLVERPAHEVFDAVWQREQIMSTGLEDGLAVPHARLPGLDKSVVVIGLSDNGVDFNAPDGEPARIICVLLTPAHDFSAQLELLDLVARAFASPEARRVAAEARSFTEFRAALSVTAPTPEAATHG